MWKYILTPQTTILHLKKLPPTSHNIMLKKPSPTTALHTQLKKLPNTELKRFPTTTSHSITPLNQLKNLPIPIHMLKKQPITLPPHSQLKKLPSTNLMNLMTVINLSSTTSPISQFKNLPHIQLKNLVPTCLHIQWKNLFTTTLYGQPTTKRRKSIHPHLFKYSLNMSYLILSQIFPQLLHHGHLTTISSSSQQARKLLKRLLVIRGKEERRKGRVEAARELSLVTIHKLLLALTLLLLQSTQQTVKPT